MTPEPVRKILDARDKFLKGDTNIDIGDKEIKILKTTKAQTSEFNDFINWVLNLKSK